MNHVYFGYVSGYLFNRYKRTVLNQVQVEAAAPRTPVPTH
jgi:hypothetical protein